MATTLETPRLRLVPITRECLGAIDDVAAIARVTHARVPASWPVEHYDQELLDFTRAALDADPSTEFVIRYIVVDDGEPAVAGMVGCGPPDATGRVLIGYSVLPEFQRRGFASEALAALDDWLYAQPGVTLIAGDTYPELIASIATMRRCGFEPAGAGDGERVIRFTLPRPQRADSNSAA